MGIQSNEATMWSDWISSLSKSKKEHERNTSRERRAEMKDIMLKLDRLKEMTKSLEGYVKTVKGEDVRDAAKVGKELSYLAGQCFYVVDSIQHLMKDVEHITEEKEEVFRLKLIEEMAMEQRLQIMK